MSMSDILAEMIKYIEIFRTQTIGLFFYERTSLLCQKGMSGHVEILYNIR
jgi:hypothetical protein